MIRYLLAGAALAAFVTPAQARDHSAYFGLEIGAMFPQNESVKTTNTNTKLFDLKYKTGADGDMILGYDFGLIRAEIEASHKWAKHDSITLPSGGTAGVTGHTSGFDGMGNVMLDLGKNDTINFFVGGGAGLAWLNQRTKVGQINVQVRDHGRFAWQAIAGVRAPVFRYFDVGLKYRYFDAGHFSDKGLRSGFRSHSILASLIYNFASEPPPPPPPPPAPERGN
jgi:opacity protein-like surface antigen